VSHMTREKSRREKCAPGCQNRLEGESFDSTRPQTKRPGVFRSRELPPRSMDRTSPSSSALCTGASALGAASPFVNSTHPPASVPRRRIRCITRRPSLAKTTTRPADNSSTRLRPITTKSPGRSHGPMLPPLTRRRATPRVRSTSRTERSAALGSSKDSNRSLVTSCNRSLPLRQAYELNELLESTATV
jgi:hypothetical protein